MVILFIQEVVLPRTTVVDRGLISEKPKWKEIVNNHQLYSVIHTDVSHFTTGPVLAYVTPVSLSLCYLCVCICVCILLHSCGLCSVRGGWLGINLTP